MPGITGPRKSHLGVRGSPGSSSRAPHLPIPAPDSLGPGPEQSVRATKELSKAPWAGPHIRRRLAGAGRGGPRGAVPPPSGLGLTEAWRTGSRRSSGLGPGQEEDLKAGPLPPRLAPAPGGSAGSRRSWRHLLADAGVRVQSASWAAVPPASPSPPAPVTPPLPRASSHYLIRSR